MKCRICGSELTTGDIDGLCGTCRSNNSSINQQQYQWPFPDSFNVGWVCPKCGTVYAPHVMTCWKCTPYQPWTITYATNNTTKS